MPYYHGESTCSKCCQRKAYFLHNEQPRCGRCANKRTPGRTNLKPNPETIAKKIAAREAHRLTFEDAARFANGRRGKVKLCKLPGGFSTRVPQMEGYISILPNFKNKASGKRMDGAWGRSTLSPKSMGPIHHGQPGLIDAETLEGFHQGSKWFLSQTFAEFQTTQIEMFKDKNPRRHHPASGSASSSNRNIPKAFIWITQDGQRHELSYLECRQFYCTFYDRIARNLPEYKELQELLSKGYNLLLCGFDAHDSTNRTLLEMYDDPSKPFGHELVLYTMLTEEDESKWPWNIRRSFEF